MEHPRVTQEHIARKAGVTRASVSLALKGHPSISSQTRERIVRLATDMGYVPDPMLSALAVYRSRNRPVTFHGTVAWLVNSAYGYDWRAVQQFADYHTGACARAKRHGFTVEIYDLNLPKLTAERLAGIFRARNISGLLLCPQPRPDTILSFRWGDFSAVTFGYTLSSPHLHTVTSTQYRDMVLAMERVRAAGHQRVGLALSREHDLRTNHNYLAGYLVDRQLAGAVAIPVHDAAYDNAPALAKWLRRNKPDAIVSGGAVQLMTTLQKLGVRVPLQVALVSPNLAAAGHRLAGVVENSLEIGAVAMDFLVAMMQRGERGIPSTPQRIHVEGEWSAGRTLKEMQTAGKLVHFT